MYVRMYGCTHVGMYARMHVGMDACTYDTRSATTVHQHQHAHYSSEVACPYLVSGGNIATLRVNERSDRIISPCKPKKESGVWEILRARTFDTPLRSFHMYSSSPSNNSRSLRGGQVAGLRDSLRSVRRGRAEKRGTP